jgi:hypothetical protein
MILVAGVVADESRQVLHRWVEAGRRAGMSWADVGELTGTSRQGAQQRFGGAVEEARADGVTGNHFVRGGVTAFNEMQVLAEEGASGGELLGTGLLTLTFRRSSFRWEYKRIVLLTASASAAKLAKAGWVPVSAWFPFLYFKRRLGA